MNIKTAILISLIVTTTLFACVTQPRIQYYDFPEDIAEEAKIANFKMLEKGRVLYNINCAKCHNKKIKGKIVIPDFTHDELKIYTIRTRNEVHVSVIPENKLTPEELEAIQFFFAYKKPNAAISGN